MDKEDSHWIARAGVSFLLKKGSDDMRKFMGNKAAIMLFTLPALLLYTVIVFYPILQTFYRSTFEWDGLSEGTFIFLDNYMRLFQDSIFYTSLYNGLVFAGSLLSFKLGSELCLLLLWRKASRE